MPMPWSCARRAAACAALALPVLGAQAQQAVYRCATGGGSVQYQAQPCGPGQQQREVVLPVAPAAPPASRVSAWKGFKPQREAAITFYYDPAHEPVGFSTERMEQMIRSAAAAWAQGCQVRISYAGRRPRSGPGTAEAVPIRWAPEYMQMRHPADARSGIAGTGSLTDGIALKPRFSEAHMPGVLVHEMGHVLGLPHNHAEPQSVMSYLRDEELRTQPQPSDADYLACNLSMKARFGIDFTPPAQAASAARRPAMSDREALERVNGPREAASAAR